MFRWLAMPLLTLALTAAPPTGPAPEFTGKQLDGSMFRSSQVVGKKVLVIDFWATWCAPCLKMLKKLQTLQEARPDVEVIAVSIDDATTLAKVGQFIQGKGYTFRVLLDPDSALLRQFNPSGEVPFCLVIDRQGKVAYIHSGYLPGDEKDLFDRLDSLK